MDCRLSYPFCKAQIYTRMDRPANPTCTEKYSELLSGLDFVVTPLTHHNAKHVFHLFVIRTEKQK